MSYCHQCGKNLSDHWSPCPDCRETPRVTPRFRIGNTLINGVTVTLLLFVAYISFEVKSPALFLSILLMFCIIYSLNVVIFSKRPDGDSESKFGEIVGDVSDGNRWIRIRLLLMNGFAIIASSIGLDSIAMNHIIFWCALILGGLIWAIPSQENQY